MINFSTKHKLTLFLLISLPIILYAINSNQILNSEASRSSAGCWAVNAKCDRLCTHQIASNDGPNGRLRMRSSCFSTGSGSCYKRLDDYTATKCTWLKGESYSNKPDTGTGSCSFGMMCDITDGICMKRDSIPNTHVRGLCCSSNEICAKQKNAKDNPVSQPTSSGSNTPQPTNPPPAESNPGAATPGSWPWPYASSMKELYEKYPVESSFMERKVCSRWGCVKRSSLNLGDTYSDKVCTSDFQCT